MQAHLSKLHLEGCRERASTPRIVDPLALNCPKCGEKLTYLRNDGEVGVYHCPNDGMVKYPPNGHVYVVTR